jgi:peptidoglycan/LPS O-acetylase OafA/YrhL
MRYIGRISYTMYLVGSMVKVLLLRHFHAPVLVMVLDISLTTAWASVSWFLMERPILNFAARKTPKRALTRVDRDAASDPEKSHAAAT